MERKCQNETSLIYSNISIKLHFPGNLERREVNLIKGGKLNRNLSKQKYSDSVQIFRKKTE